MEKYFLALGCFLLLGTTSYGEEEHHHEKKHSQKKEHSHKEEHHHKKRHHKAHSHGSGKLSLVTSGNKLLIELEVPGHDVVGFEHEAKTKKQKARLSKAIAFLKKTESNIGLPEKSGCQHDGPGDVKVELGGDHSEFHIKYNFTCSNVKELSYVQVLSFKRFNGMKKLKAQAVTDSGQNSRILTSRSPKFDLGS